MDFVFRCGLSTPDFQSLLRTIPPSLVDEGIGRRLGLISRGRNVNGLCDAYNVQLSVNVHASLCVLLLSSRVCVDPFYNT